MRKHLLMATLMTLCGVGGALWGQPAPDGPGMGRNEKFPPRENAPRHPPLERKLGNWGRGEDVIVTMAKLKKEQPEQYQKLEKLRQSDMQKFIAEIKPFLPKRNNETMRKFQTGEQEIRTLAEQIRNEKDEAKREELKTLLKQKVKEGFSLMLKDTEERIQKMQQRIVEIKENEEFIIQDRYEMLLKGPRDK